jgi:hypothetical protein
VSKEFDGKFACLTIADSKYLSQVIVLAESFYKFHPNADFYFISLDNFSNYKVSNSRVLTLDLNELGIPPKILQNMQSYYDVVELATALKPWALLKVLELNYDCSIYLDPDILVTNSLEKALESASKYGMALTPSRINLGESFIPDGDELGLLRYGSFNLGFVACTLKSKDILLWWQKRLIWYSTRAKYHFHFTDQKWMDILPSSKKIGILNDYGFNLTLVNLNERKLSYKNRKIYANENLLVFVHFIQNSEKLKKKRVTTRLSDLTESSNSAAIYSYLTQDYVNRLTKVSESLPSEDAIGYNVKYKSILVREYLRQRSIKRYIETQEISEIKFSWFLKIFSYIFIPFEKSFTFQFAIFGFMSDVKRVRAKLADKHLTDIRVRKL